MILPRKEVQETRGPNYIDSMLQHEGKLLRIRDIIKDTCYLEENGYIWQSIRTRNTNY